jgi:hypothetical protein
MKSMLGYKVCANAMNAMPMVLQLVQPWEQDQVSRLIEYLDVVKTPHRNTADRALLEHDFKVFHEHTMPDAARIFEKLSPTW